MKPSDPTFLPSIYDARNLFSGKWMLAIAVVLLDGPMRYKEILSSVRSLEASIDWHTRHRVLREGTLTQTLRRMTSDDLIIREEAQAVFPPSVRYTLSPATREVLDSSVPLAEWAQAHSALIEPAKRRRMRSADHGR